MHMPTYTHLLAWSSSADCCLHVQTAVLLDTRTYTGTLGPSVVSAGVTAS